LLLLEHPPVITLGRSSRREHILSSRDELTRAGVELIEVARGGDVTYHAPGQLVGYLIADLRTGAEGTPDVIAFLRAIERTLVRALDSCGVPATTLGGMTGVFVDRMGSKRPNGPERKLASIGIGVRAWVSMHGFALNVSNPIDGFRHIVPCGLEHVRMTSVAEELGATAEIDARVRAAVSYAFQHCFG
jgi:lipoate-protein ligase B